MKTAISLVTTLAACSVLLVAAPADASGKYYYSSCAKLTKVYKHGVAKSAAAARKQVNQGYGRPAYGTKAKKVYAENKGRLDRDKDGTACER